MTQAEKRVRRKDLREPDEFITLSARVAAWARANQTAVVAGAAAFGVLVLLVAGIRWWVESRDAAATDAFYGATELFKREQWAEAQKSYADLAEKYGSTPYGKLARLYAGRSALLADKPGDAVPFLRAYVADAPDPALEQLARVSLARALEESGDPAGAREELSRATQLAGPAGPQATLGLARLEEAAGAKDKAIELYQKYLADDPQGASADLARMRLAALGVAPPPSPPSALSFPPGSGLAMPPIEVQ